MNQGRPLRVETPSLSDQRLADIFTHPVVSLQPTASVAQALALMSEQRISAVIICDARGHPTGIFTERDAVLASHRGQAMHRLRIGQLMTAKPITARPSLSCERAYALMEEHRIRHLIVVDEDGRLLGIVSESDLLNRIEAEYLLELREVAAVMNPHVVTLHPTHRLGDAIRAMAERRISSVVVSRRGHPVGVLSERDITRFCAGGTVELEKPLCVVMSQPVFTVKPETSLVEAINLMQERRCRRLVVSDEQGCISGILTRKDIIRSLQHQQLETLRQQVHELAVVVRASRAREVAERELATAREHLAALLGALPVAVQECDLEGRIVYANQIHQQLFRRSAKEMLGSHIWDRKPDETSRQALKQHFAELLQNGCEATPPYITRELRGDGELITLQVDWAHKRDAEGRLIGFIAVLRDISYEHQRDALLNLQHRALEAAPTGIVITDARADNHPIVYSNAAVSRLSGYSAEELLGKNCRLLQRQSCDRAALDEIRAALDEGRGCQVVLPNQRKNGEAFLNQLTLSPVHDEDGLVSHHVGIQEDVTERERAAAELRASEARFFSLAQFAPLAVFETDLEGRCTYSNPHWHALSQLSAEQSLGFGWRDALHPEDRAAVESAWRQSCQQGTPFSMEYRLLRADGSERWVHDRAALRRDDSGEAVGWVGVVEDISERREGETHRQLAAKVFDNTSEGIFITDARGRILDVNRAFTEITGYAAAEIVGQDPRRLKSGRHDEAFYQQLWHSLSEAGQWRGEIWNRRRNGDVHPALLSISGVYDAGGKLSHYVSVFSDISHAKRTEEHLEYLAHHDALTGLPNRLLCSLRLEHAIRHAERSGQSVGVIFIDLDNFKDINDSLGHLAGDEVLHQLAQHLSRCIRNQDTAARIGGDEFVVLLERLDDPEDAVVVIEKLSQALSQTVQLGEHLLSLSASMGISLYPRDGRDYTELLRNADAAMYRAKAAGRNTYEFYTRDLTERAFERVMLESQLRRALEQGEFTLHYQPLLQLRQPLLAGAEVLLRWNNAELGLVAPSRFIPQAEENGLMESIGEWVLNQACRQARQWLDEGLDFGRISVNISASQLKRSALSDTVLKALEASGLPGERLALELTETTLMADPERAIEVFSRLQEHGVSIAVDDFGTGYSSLSYLKRLPLNTLKIDASFVHELPQDEDNRAIVDTVIALGHSLRLQVIAEGVESQAQNDALLSAGCDQIQGRHSCPPVSATEFANWARRHTH